MEDHHHLLQPLTTTTRVTVTGNGDKNNLQGDYMATEVSFLSIVLRLVTVLLIATISLWANYEASKGFEINIINDAYESLASRRFSLLYVSNDKATRIVLNASEFVESVLYPSNIFTKKPISCVTIKLAGRNLTSSVIVKTISKDEFVLEISPMVMEEANFEKRLVSAVHQGMARIWLWGDVYGAPQPVIDGIVQYICITAGLNSPSLLDSGWEPLPGINNSCWNDRNPVAVAKFLEYCEGRAVGFIRRLNQAMKDGRWSERAVDDALREPAQQVCRSFHSSIRLARSGSGLAQVSMR